MEKLRKSRLVQKLMARDHREPILFGIGVRKFVYILCSCKICFVGTLFIVKIVLMAIGTGASDDYVGQITAAIILLAAYGGCIQGVRLRNRILLWGSTLLLSLITCLRIAGIIVDLIKVSKFSNEEFREHYLKQGVSELDASDIPRFRIAVYAVKATIMACVLFFNLAIVSACVIYVNYLKHKRFAPPDIARASARAR